MIRAGILGATGYTGYELVRLLKNHPYVELTYLGSSSSAGRPYAEIYPQLAGDGDLMLGDEEVPDVDVLFCALPHGLTAHRASGWLERGIRVIDLGADFRIKDAGVYEQWYNLKHPAPQLLEQAVYGLPEIYREGLKGTALVANPGCYPTASILPLWPLLKEKLIKTQSIIIDAASGVSGAGRGTGLGTHFSEVNENFKAYGVASHRHTPEIEQELGKAAQTELRINFTPHLVPMIRGILTTIYVEPQPGVEEEDLRAAWKRQYGQEPFVHLLPEGVWPQTKFASGSNHAFLQLTVDRRTGRAILIAAIDNLIKGAAGQAVQNMNILFGFPEETGLQAKPLWP